jgi:hypothetical protein
MIQTTDIPPFKKYPLKEYEIWIGSYHLGQGYDPPTKPEMVAKVVAPNFKVACFLHELRSSLKSVESRMMKDEYIDHQSCRWWYNFDTNSNDWTGKYFETKEDALKTF